MSLLSVVWVVTAVLIRSVASLALVLSIFKVPAVPGLTSVPFALRTCCAHIAIRLHAVAVWNNLDFTIYAAHTRNPLPAVAAKVSNARRGAVVIPSYRTRTRCSSAAAM